MTVKIKKQSNIQLYMLSIVIFQIGTIIRLQLHSQLVGNSFRIIGFLVLVYSLLRECRIRTFFRLPFSMKFLLSWNVANILYSIFWGGGLNFTRTFGEDSYVLNYILPFLLLYDVSKLSVKNLFQYSLVFALFAIVLIALNYEFLILANSSYGIQTLMSEQDGLGSFAQLPVMWSIPAAIIFMNPELSNKRNVIISICAFVLAISFSMTFGRRGTSLYGALFLCAGYFVFLKNKKYTFNQKLALSFVIFLLAAIVIPFVLNHFVYIFERGLEDSRSAVNEAFYADMDVLDYIFGRGLNGTYYDPLIIFEDLNFQRPGHETGFLNIILHAGLLYLIPYVFICLKSVYLGIFKSNNTWIKSLAVYILLNTLMLFVGSYPAFNLRFFILWIGILYCNHKAFRKMKNNEIKHYLLS